MADATVTLNDLTVFEGSGTATISASVDIMVTGSPLVITLDNGASITIAENETTGTSTPFAVQGDDPYVDGESYTVAITGTTGSDFETVNKADTALVTVTDTLDPVTVDLSASSVSEGAVADYVFTATLSDASQGVTTIHTDQGDITIADGASSGALTLASGNGEDVYLDASSLTATITGTDGGNFENLTVGTAAATAEVTDTIDPVTVDLSASSVSEGAVADYVFTATLSDASQGVTTIHTDQGDISIADGASSGALTLASGNGEDVYLDASSLTASITGTEGGNFENLTVGTAAATAEVTDTVTAATVDLSASSVSEGAVADYVFTATLSDASQGVTTIHTDQGDISIADGASSGALTLASGNGEDVYLDASSLTASITGTEGGNFENLTVGTAAATAEVTDTLDPVTVDLSASSVSEGAVADYVFTATLSDASQGVTTIHTDQGDISIADGASSGALTLASGNGEDVYLDASSLTASITGTEGGNFENLTVGTAAATAEVTDTVTAATVDLSASSVSEGAVADYVFTATLSDASQGVTTIHTDQGDISIADGASSGALTLASGNGEDVYLDASSLTATITGTEGGNFENLTVGTAAATAEVTDTLDPVTVDLSASSVSEGAVADYVFTATLSDASQGVTTIHTDQGDITIADGASSGALTLASGNGEDVYLDASSLTATITGTDGGNFENLTVGTAAATAEVTDTIDPVTVDLSASSVSEGAVADYVFTATLSDASQGVTTIHTDQGDISIADGASSGALTLASGNGEDVYLDASSLTASITGTEGGNFENLTVGTAAATAEVTDTLDPVTVDLSASSVSEGAVADYVFTATLSDASQGVTTIHTDQGDISIADGESSGALTLASGNGEDVYLDASSLTASITGTDGGNFENLTVGTAAATAEVTDTVTAATVDLSASSVSEGAVADYVFTATLSDASQGVTTIHTDQGDISIADGASSGALTLASGNGEDVYLDASSLTATITGTEGGNFENLTVGTAAATAEVTDTLDPVTVDLSASSVSEGAVADYVFTATLSDASQGVTTIHTDQGDISIADGASSGALTLASGNGEDVYLDASSLTASITGTEGGNFENLTVGTAAATAEVTDTVTAATVDLSASSVSEGAVADYVFTATLSDASQGVTTIHTDQGDISIADGASSGALTLASGNGEDVYLDASSLTASITGTEGGNFENLTVGTAAATAEVTDTVTAATVDLSASSVSEGAVADYVFTATLSDASQGVTTIHTDQGDITIADGASSGALTLASGNGEDVYLDASSLTATITGTEGGNFENLTVGTAAATAEVTDTVTAATVDLSASSVSEGAVADYVFTATLSDASQGVTTIHTDQGDISIADGASSGALTLASGNGEDVYLDASSLTASITGTEGGNFENLTVGTAAATAEVTDTVTAATVDLSASSVSEGAVADYVFTATLSDASQGVTTIHTDQGDISIADGASSGALTLASGNGEDVYLDASSLTASITGTEGGNFENLTVGTAAATAEVTDTLDPVTVDLSASSVSEGAVADYVFTATLSDASQGVTTIHTDQGDITIADGASSGALTLASGNGEDVYLDASSLTATITGTDGGNFENLTVGTAAATAEVTDTIDPVTVDLSASSVSEGAVADYVFTATLSDASQGVTTIHTDQGDISIADGASSGALTLASGNGEDVYLDASSLTASITGTEGGNFENLTVGTAAATAEVTDTLDPVTVDLSASSVSEGAVADYVFTATLSDASQGVTTIHTDQGDISIADGASSGALTLASGNGEDVYLDASSLTATITGTEGGNFENLTVGTAAATAEVTDTVTAATVDLSASSVSEGAVADYVFTATLSDASQGVTTIHTDQGDISIADGASSGALTLASGNGEDVYLDASSLTASITGTDGGNFENLTVGTAAATAEVTDTVTAATVDLSASSVSEGAVADYVFTATLSDASQGVTTIHTDQGDISIADGASSGALTLASGNGEDVYLDASSLTASITGTEGGNFENLTVGTAAATAEVTDTVTAATVDLSASSVSEGAVADYVFTATLSDASQGVTTIHTDQGDITIADGASSGALTLASGNGEDVYLDASSLTASITGTEGGNFENLTVGTAAATAEVTDTLDPVTVDLSASSVSEGAVADYVFTATLSDASQGVTTIHTDQGDISIADGASSGALTLASGNGEDVYLDASSLTASITGTEGGNFENLTVGTAAATAEVTDTLDPVTVDLSASSVSEGAVADYVFTATLSDASQGVTTIHTDQGDISIADGASSGALTLASGNGEDVYLDASSLTATITGTEGGNFENLTVGTAAATAEVTDTVTAATVDLSASSVSEGAVADYVFTATLSDASQGVTTIHTDQGDISIADGASSGALTLASGNGEDVYLDASSLTASITGTDGGNFENLTVGTAAATAEVTDTLDPVTVTLDDAVVNEGAGTATIAAHLDNAVTGSPLVITLSNGATITIAVSATSGTSTTFAAPDDGTVSISGTTGGNFEALDITDTALVSVNDDVEAEDDKGTVTVHLNDNHGHNGHDQCHGHGNHGGGDGNMKLVVSADDGVLSNDTSDDGELHVSAVNGDTGDVGDVIMLDSGAKLKLNEDGSYVYDPSSLDVLKHLKSGSFIIHDTFSYTASDENGDSDTAVVDITIQVDGNNGGGHGNGHGNGHGHDHGHGHHQHHHDHQHRHHESHNWHNDHHDRHGDNHHDHGDGHSSGPGGGHGGWNWVVWDQSPQHDILGGGHNNHGSNGHGSNGHSSHENHSLQANWHGSHGSGQLAMAQLEHHDQHHHH